MDDNFSFFVMVMCTLIQTHARAQRQTDRQTETNRDRDRGRGRDRQADLEGQTAREGQTMGYRDKQRPLRQTLGERETEKTDMHGQN